MRAESNSITTVIGSSEAPAASGRVAEHALQLDRQEEQRPAEGAVHDEGHGVGGAELRGPEELERQDGVIAARLDREEAGQRDHAGEGARQDDGSVHPRAGPSVSA